MADNQTNVPVKSEARFSTPATSRDWDPFDSLHREFDELFNTLRSSFWGAPLRSRRDVQVDRPNLSSQFLAPAIDIAERNGGYEITAEMPGISADEISVSVADRRLTIKGEKKQERKEEKEGYHLSERRFGTFQRSFSLPEGIDAGKISADFKDGVLTISLPKPLELQRQERKIAIQSR
jgi:HSP20 family protein